MTFQAFSLESLIGEIMALEQELIFSPNIILYTFADKRAESYGATFPRLSFRRYKSSVEFALAGLTAEADLLLDNWKDEPEDDLEVNSGMIFKLSGATSQEVNLAAEARFGAREGVTCFGNCLGPRKLQQLAVQRDNGFEEFVISADNFPFPELDLNLSSRLSSDRGFEGLNLRGSRSWDYRGGTITCSSSLSLSPRAFVPFAGTSITWNSEPFVLTLYFDDTFRWKNTLQSLQFNPDLSGADIEGIQIAGDSLLNQQLNLNLTIPTDSVDLAAAFRGIYEDEGYRLGSGLLSIKTDPKPLGFKVILAFREDSQILKVESQFKF
ncbi:MAG: hypothetical protein ACLFN4_01990 [Candidatus Acetothermia bacterium]